MVGIGQLDIGSKGQLYDDDRGVRLGYLVSVLIRVSAVLGLALPHIAFPHIIMHATSASLPPKRYLE